MSRLVIKLGSSSIARRDGLALDVMAGLVTQIAAAQRAGHEIILVTSGAARLGQRLLAFEGPTAGAAPALRTLAEAVRTSLAAPTETAAPADVAAEHARLTRALQQALGRLDGQVPDHVDVALPAAVGQPALMALYRQLAAPVGLEVCQILISRGDLSSARAMADLGHLLREAVARGLLPIVNGNDATDPQSALDNDQVAVAVSVAAEASRLLFLTDVRAAYRDATLRDRLTRLTPAEARAVRVAPSSSGRGGMGSKLGASARAACCGVECVIASAQEPEVVSRSLNPRARVGTVIRAAGGMLGPAQRWIGGMAYSAGSLQVNRNAELSLRTGSTLFLSGVKRVDGEFAAGDVVELVDVRHPDRLLGRGSVALQSSMLRLLRALPSQHVACVVSTLLRIRYAARDDGVATLTDPAAYPDCKELAAGESRACQEAYTQLTALSMDRAAELADSLLLAQPALCTAFLLDAGFRDGRVPADAPSRGVVRGMHAVHRESLVVYPEAAPG